MIFVKLYGERNTGTNYLAQLLLQNIELRYLRGTIPIELRKDKTEEKVNEFFRISSHRNLGWKHGYINFDVIQQHPELAHIRFITLTKNPYSFLLSLYKKPYHTKKQDQLGFLDFLQRPWPLQERDNLRRPYLPNPIELWNTKNRRYIELKNTWSKQSVNLTYESLVRDPENVLLHICSDLGLNTKGSFNNIHESTKNKSLSFDEYRDYYLNQQWKTEMTQKDISVINDALDHDLVRTFDYEIISELQT